jgi:5'(3')-deoxyribonucleotidase
VASKPLTVLIDLDSTVYDLISATLPWVNNKYGLNLTPQDLKEWSWYEPLGVNTHEFWHTEGVFLNLKPFPHVATALKKVNDWGIKQVFFSAVGFKYAVPEKLQAIDRDFPFIGRKRALFTGGDKDLAIGDMLVDDGPHNNDLFKAGGGTTVIADLQGAPYTRLHTAPDYVMTDWRQYPDIIMQEVRKRG